MSRKRNFNNGQDRVTRNANRMIRKGLDPVELLNCRTPFYATKDMFTNYLSFDKPLSYDEWLATADDNKAAVLFVQFFDQITLAWYKLKTDAAIEEECVEVVLQYLMKNVPILVENPARFSPKYIYKICYNCIYCKSIDPYKGQTAKTSWYNNTTSQYVQCGEDTLDLFDLASDDSEDADAENVINRERFWAIIEDMGSDTLSVVAKLLGDTSRTKRSEEQFQPVELPKVSKAKEQKILDKLREVLAPFKDLYYV